MKIHKLTPQESQKIAAGEVVERPANIIKELVENSLDAGATVITVSVFEGGKASLSVTDNGSGMDADDAIVCFERHTTSKITTIDQLHDITTFGFRGEALASICSVARVTLTTKQRDSQEGLELSIEQGVITNRRVIGCQIGTSIEIKDLFYTVPVRKKFLKATATEWNHILTLIKAFALHRNDVHFILKHNGAAVLNCPPIDTTVERVQQIFEPPLTDFVCALEPRTENGITVSGALTTQQYARYDRGGLFFFVNNRWIKNHQLGTAVTKGYLNVLPHGRYPAAFLSITLDPHLVDINVHPKKEEVLFVHPHKVAHAITAAVKKTLENLLSAQLKKTVSFSSHTELYPAMQAFQDHSPYDRPQHAHVEIQRPTYVQNINTALLAIPEDPFTQTTIQQKVSEDFGKNEHSVAHEYRLIGQYNKTYLLLDTPEGLMVVDQHAAHERILYERFATRFDALEPVALLFPHSLTVPSSDLDALESHYELFEEFGVHLERMGKDQLIIKATPVCLRNQSLDDLIAQTIGWVKESYTLSAEDLHKKITEKVRAQMACKAAVKAGDILPQETMEQLLADLACTNNRFTCPHGRPTSWTVRLYDLEKQFKRKL